MVIADYISTVKNSFGSNGGLWAGVGSIAGIFILIIWAASRSGLLSGTGGEGHAVRGMDYALTGLGWTGAQLWRALRASPRAAARLGRFSLKVYRGGDRLARDAAKTLNYYMGESTDIFAETLHQTSAAAATDEAAQIIGKLTNAEIDLDGKKREALEQRIRNLIASLVAVTETKQVDDATRKFVIDLGEQITTALIELTNSETFEIQIRKKSFSSVYELLKVVKIAETLARRVENKAKRDERKLLRFNDKEIKDLKDKLTEKAERSSKMIDTANKALGASEATRAAERLAEIDKKMIEENVVRLIQVLEQLHAMNKRMLGTINIIRRDISEALDGIKDVLQEWKALEDAESEVDKFAIRIKNAAQTARANLNSMKDGSVDEIIIKLTADSAIIFENMAQISRRISTIDNKQLLPLLVYVQRAMNLGYRAEEASRIANRYFAQLVKAQEQFSELVKTVDLSREAQTAFAQEIEIEEMEEKIASKQESVEQAAKSLFIRARNILERSRVVVVQHIDYLENNAAFTIETKNYVLNKLQTIMQGMHDIKVQLNADFKKRVEEYRQRLAQAQSQQTLERLAA